MNLKAWHIPLRLATGAFIFNSGWSKRGATGEAAEGLHGFATAGHPELEPVEPETFAKSLSTGEMALGGALLLPLVPSWLAGGALTLFSLGLNRLYWKAPGLRQEGDIRPTEQGQGIAKDLWMTAIGLSLVIDAIADARERRSRAPLRRMARIVGR